MPVAYKRRISVKHPLTVFSLAPVAPYSSEVQQPMRATAVLGRHPHTHWAASSDREQGRAGSLHPEGPAARPGSTPLAASFCRPSRPDDESQAKGQARNARGEPPQAKRHLSGGCTERCTEPCQKLLPPPESVHPALRASAFAWALRAADPMS